MSSAMMVPSSAPDAAPPGDSLRRTYWLQAPGRRAQVDHQVARA